MYNNGKTLHGEKLFVSYESVFALARGLRHSQTSINNKDQGPTYKERDRNQMQRQHLVIVFCVLALSTVICRPVGFKSVRKCLIKQFIQGKDLTVTNVLFCYGHVSLKNRSSLAE